MYKLFIVFHRRLLWPDRLITVYIICNQGSVCAGTMEFFVAITKL